MGEQKVQKDSNLPLFVVICPSSWLTSQYTPSPLRPVLFSLDPSVKQLTFAYIHYE